jgi:hypothetical protein
MPLIAVPLLLIAAFVDLGHGGFLVLFALIALFLIGGHFGLHSTLVFFIRAPIGATARAGRRRRRKSDQSPDHSRPD